METKLFEVGHRVFDLPFGWGVVESICAYDVLVKWDKTTFGIAYYLLNGKQSEDSNRSLYHYDYSPEKQLGSDGELVPSNKHINTVSKDNRLEIASKVMVTLIASGYRIDVVSDAVKYADDLINELNKE